MAIPFMASAILFLSALFSVFAPLPLALVAAERKWQKSVGCLLTNAVLVAYFGGWFSLGLYFSLIVPIGIWLPYQMLQGRRSINKLVGWSLLGVAAFVLVFGLGFWIIRHQSPLQMVHRDLIAVLTQMTENAQEGSSLKELSDGSVQDQILIELPSAFGIFAVIMAWLNLSLLTRLLPVLKRAPIALKDADFKAWKAPEYLVWPTIVAGALLLKDLGWPSDVGVNLFKLLMAVYALQGLCIMGAALDRFSITGIFRPIVAIILVFTFLPLVIGVGFFDLWFDFRKKLGQSSEDS